MKRSDFSHLEKVKNKKLWEKQRTKEQRREEDANKISFGGKYRYVARTSQNNGIKGYIDEDTAFLNDGKTISFAHPVRYDTNDNKLVVIG